MRRTDPKDQRRSYFRSSARTFQMNGGWFFATREGERGPFPNQSVAEAEMQRFVDDLQELKGFQHAREHTKVRPVPTTKELAARRAREQAQPREDLVLDDVG